VLASRDENGHVYRDLLEGQAERLRKSGRNPEKLAALEAEIAGPACPPALAYLWRAFTRLSARRPLGFGVSPITWPDLDAFVRLTGFTLAPWEVDVIEDLDALFMAEAARARSTK
jgi:hypothetical protein